MGRNEFKRILARSGETLAAARSIDMTRERCQKEVGDAAAAVRAREVRQQLAELPLETLRGVVGGRVAWSALLGAGYGSVADVESATDSELLAIDGVGEASVALLKRAVDEIRETFLRSTNIGLRLDSDHAPDERLLMAVVALDDVLSATRTVAPVVAAYLDIAPEEFDRAARLRSPLRWLLARRRSRLSVQNAAERLQELDVRYSSAIRVAANALPASRGSEEARRAFTAEPARFQALLESISGIRPTQGQGVPRELAEAIEAFPLDVSALRVMLRRYQQFGAKFILTQRRVLLGDDMGLGKTVQALAAMAHLTAELVDFRALVVAPASVLVNWRREIEAKSDLVAVTPEEWALAGGVLVTTFERLKNVKVDPSVPLHLLVVDEAHYIKNPDTQRTQRVRDLVSRAERVLFMTGTAIENRGAEFVELVRLLDPGVASGLAGPAALIAPQEFRARVAKLYLRRNADEVLTELPELIEVDEWEEMTSHDFEHYRKAVCDGNLMSMRRAAFMAGTMRRSAKLNRLLELVSDASASGRKVIVYSYFLDVLTIVMDALPRNSFGPITGATSPSARQALVDEFTAAPSGSVLISQVIAGGVGLNIQAASVVILCEPQLKPSTENQAIARARRMGQLKTVHVHRLLSPDSIDERVLEILSGKTEVFDRYARDSDLAAASEIAVDARTALLLVANERFRLGLPSRDAS